MTDFDEVRSAREIGERALILGFILSAFRLRGQEEQPYAPLIVAAKPSLLPTDEELLNRGYWSDAVQGDLLWQTECLHVLLYAIEKRAEVPPVDQEVDASALVEEINAMARDVEGWMGSARLRPRADLDLLNEQVSFWLWRVRSRPKKGRKLLSPFVKDAVSSAVERGVLRPDETSGNDALCFGRPFFELEVEQQDLVHEIVEERCRAVFWIWKDFDDWWNPILDS